MVNNQLVSVCVDLDQFWELQGWAQDRSIALGILWVRRGSVICCFRADSRQLMWLILRGIVAV